MNSNNLPLYLLIFDAYSKGSTMELSEIGLLDNFPVWSVICPYYGYLDEWFTMFKGLDKRRRSMILKNIKTFPASMKSYRKHLRISVPSYKEYEIVYDKIQKDAKKSGCIKTFKREDKDSEMWRIFPLFLFEMEHSIDRIDGAFTGFLEELIYLKYQFKNFCEFDALYNDYRPFQQHLVWDTIYIEGKFVQTYIPLLIKLGDIRAIEKVDIDAKFYELFDESTVETLKQKHILDGDEKVSFELIGSVKFDEIKAFGELISTLEGIGYKFKRIYFRHPVQCDKSSYNKVDLKFTQDTLQCVQLNLGHDCIDKKCVKHLINLEISSIMISVSKEDIRLESSSTPKIEILQFFDYMKIPNNTELSLSLEQNQCLIINMLASDCREKHLANDCVFGIHDKKKSITTWYRAQTLKIRYYKLNVEKIDKWLFIGALIWIEKEGLYRHANPETFSLNEIPTINFDEKMWSYTLIINEDETTEVKVPSFNFSISKEELIAINNDAERIRNMMDPSDYDDYDYDYDFY